MKNSNIDWSNREHVLKNIVLGDIHVKDIVKYYKDDEEIILKSLKKCIWTYDLLEKISNRLKNNRHFILEAVKENGFWLSVTNDEIRDDKEVILEAVKQCGLVLCFSSKRLKDDENVVWNALNSSYLGGSVIMHASKRIRGIKKYAFKAIQDRVGDVIFVDSNILNDSEILKYLSSSKDLVYQIESSFNCFIGGYSCISKITEEYESYTANPIEDFVIKNNDNSRLLLMLEQSEIYLKHFSKRLREDKDFILSLFANGYFYDYDSGMQISIFKELSEKSRKDKDFILGIFRKCGVSDYNKEDKQKMFSNISSEIKFDSEFNEFI